MERGYEEISTNQAGRKRGTPWETPTVSSLVDAISVKELRSFSHKIGGVRRHDYPNHRRGR